MAELVNFVLAMLLIIVTGIIVTGGVTAMLHLLEKVTSKYDQAVEQSRTQHVPEK